MEYVSVNIQHSAVISTEKECSKLKYVITNCTQKKIPYRFKDRD